MVSEHEDNFLDGGLGWLDTESVPRQNKSGKSASDKGSALTDWVGQHVYGVGLGPGGGLRVPIIRRKQFGYFCIYTARPHSTGQNISAPNISVTPHVPRLY